MQLGDRLRSLVSGYEGVAIAKVEYLNGCQRFQLQREVGPDGALPEAEWFDIQELETVKEAAVVLPGWAQRAAEAAEYVAERLRVGPGVGSVGGGANPPERDTPA